MNWKALGSGQEVAAHWGGGLLPREERAEGETAQAPGAMAARWLEEALRVKL
jgi:hypothetical protein